MGDELDLEHFRRLLQQRLDELQRQIQGEESRDQAVELDQSKVGRLSRMDALQQQAMLDATHARTQHECIRLQRALQRLYSGDYGWCSQCDEAIAVARLEIDPAAQLCIRCAESAERQPK